MSTTTRALSVCALAIAAGSASADVLETIDFGDLVHGEIVSTQYQGSHGVTIDARNYSRNFDLAVAFDTHRTGTRDDDLEDPWSGGNLAGNTNLGNALILQENNYGIGDGIADRPDDEGSRPAGWIRFSFDEVKTGIGFDILDLESPDVEATSLKLYLDGSLVASIDFADFINPGSDLYDASVSFGNNSANRIGLISAADLGIAGFDTAKFKFGGSMAIDTIKTVPAPGTFALLGLGGACVARRRR
mgnify:CR=1 FL=1|jgi:hypothetical protein